MSCATQLGALARGDWPAWDGLSPDCRREHAELALGATGPDPDASGALAGSPATFRAYPPSPAAPYGIQVWFAVDQIILVQINSPTDPEGRLTALGEPELVLPSGLAARHDQWVYPGRGLVFHLHSRRHELRRVYGFEPMTPQQFTSSWLAEVRLDREPR